MSDPLATTGLPIADAARALGERVGTLRRWVREGCPTINPGRRGRGHAVLVDVDAVRLWRSASEREAVILELASSLPELLAGATIEAWKQAEDIDKRRLAEILAASWYISATSTLDYLRSQCAAVPDVLALPAQIERLRKIAQ